VLNYFLLPGKIKGLAAGLGLGLSNFNRHLHAFLEQAHQLRVYGIYSFS